TARASRVSAVAARSTARSIPAVRPSIARFANAEGVASDMVSENILVEMHGRVSLIRLNRPQALNALNTALINDLVAALRSNDSDDAIAATVLTGSEKAFAAGADIKEMAALGFVEAFTREQASEIAEVAAMRKPIIAAVAGYCLGGGAELAMMCDIL